MSLSLSTSSNAGLKRCSATHKSPRSSDGLYLFLQKLVTDFSVYNVVDFGLLFWKAAILPILVVMLSLFLLLQSYLWIRRKYIYPPTAPDFHREALMLYHESKTSHYKPRKKARIVAKVQALLEQAIQLDPHYRPAYLSMAAQYLYNADTRREPEKALQVLNRCKQYCGGIDPDIRALGLDALAIQQGEEHMIQDVLRHEEYLSLACVGSVDKKQTKSMDASSVKKENVEPTVESKKDR